MDEEGNRNIWMHRFKKTQWFFWWGVWRPEVNLRWRSLLISILKTFIYVFVCLFIYLFFQQRVSHWTWHSWVRLGCPAGNVLGCFCSQMASGSSQGCWDLSSGVQAWVASSPHRALSPHPLAICFISCMVTVKIQCTYFLNSCRLPMKCICVCVCTCMVYFRKIIFQCISLLFCYYRFVYKFHFSTWAIIFLSESLNDLEGKNTQLGFKNWRSFWGAWILMWAFPSSLCGFGKPQASL